MSEKREPTSSRARFVPRVPSFRAPALVLTLSLFIPAAALLCAFVVVDPPCTLAVLVCWRFFCSARLPSVILRRRFAGTHSSHLERDRVSMLLRSSAPQETVVWLRWVGYKWSIGRGRWGGWRGSERCRARTFASSLCSGRGSAGLRHPSSSMFRRRFWFSGPWPRRLMGRGSTKRVLAHCIWVEVLSQKPWIAEFCRAMRMTRMKKLAKGRVRRETRSCTVNTKSADSSQKRRVSVR